MECQIGLVREPSPRRSALAALALIDSSCNRRKLFSVRTRPVFSFDLNFHKHQRWLKVGKGKIDDNASVIPEARLKKTTWRARNHFFRDRMPGVGPGKIMKAMWHWSQKHTVEDTKVRAPFVLRPFQNQNQNPDSRSDSRPQNLDS